MKTKDILGELKVRDHLSFYIDRKIKGVEDAPSLIIWTELGTFVLNTQNPDPLISIFTVGPDESSLQHLGPNWVRLPCGI